MLARSRSYLVPLLALTALSTISATALAQDASATAEKTALLETNMMGSFTQPLAPSPSDPENNPVQRPALVLQSPARDSVTDPAEKKKPEGPSLHYQMETQVASSYVWRGAQFGRNNQDPFSFNYIQVQAKDLGPGTLSVMLWNSVPIGEGAGGNGGNKEFVPIGLYSVNLGHWVRVDGGYKYSYQTVDTPHNFRTEWLGKVFITGDLPVQPLAGVAVDPVIKKGYYGWTGLQTSHKVWSELTLGGSATVGVSRYPDVPFDWHDVSATANASYGFMEGFYVSALGGFGYATRAQKFSPWTGLALGVDR